MITNIDKIKLLGKHYFTGFDNSTEKEKDNDWYSGRECDAYIFEIDGVTYKAVENPDDGYRSFLGNFFITNEKCKNIIPIHEVNVIEDKTEDIIHFVDVLTNLCILSIGTNHEDSYYPYCVMNWQPNNLAINYDSKKYHKWAREKKLNRILQ